MQTPDGFQPMDSAPKDGRNVVLAFHSDDLATNQVGIHQMRSFWLPMHQKWANVLSHWKPLGWREETKADVELRT